ncbi:peptidoglycan-recognition protein LC-like isoform X4 [Lucilia sericata]|uniref:peptidoglycan-recognition protein LC-like isoform X4 n=1 Tax=Lucilia sericata TaxID=13632 RepID=UPI0018A7FE4A|nr:peptidoglycan-recognition protein LC-like isoform X4 [Lucilia sericata]XP_037805984.1 peptidoglycan-recognition protein LC-like isoform X4 [Lucilia sericata]
MHYDKQCNNLIQNKINTNCTPSTTPKETGSSETKSNINSESILSFHVNTKNRNTIKQHEASDIGTYTEHTSTSCTSSTDSGVNVSDNDEIPPSPTSSHLHSFPSTSSSSSETTTTKPFNKQFHKNNKNPNRDNNINNSKDNHFKNHNNDNYDRDDDDEDDNNSTNTDNKLKSEELRKRQQQQQQQFLKLENSSDGDNNTLYQQNQNVIESENVINISHQRNSTIPTLRVSTPPPPETTTTTATNNDKPSLKHNEFINRPQRSASISSSLSMSSIMSTQSDDQHNPPSKTHYCSGSPVVSIRSINSSTIITSDSDSDSDLSGDTEGAHSNYVIKKLGTQVTYPPKHPAIPNINSGHTVLNQQIVPNCENAAASPLATLAAIGDSIGAAQALGPIPSLSAVPQRPQIGSIALSNSSDVTFGDKHFYEGPVTIQQFLIDGRDKWKETSEKENPTFVNDNGENCNNAKDINSSAEQSGKLYGYISKHKKIIIPGVLAFMAMLIVATILGSRALSDSKTQDNVGGGYVLRMVPRDGWLAQPPLNNWVPLKLPVKRVIVIPTRTQECETQASCTYTVRITQTYNIESQQQDDIIYNFLIGGDGNVYEGRGWNNKGSVIKGFNDDSISFAYIGSFKKMPPSYRQLNVTKLLLEEGVRLKKLSPDYEIVGANKLDPTSVITIADALYKSFENWPHWSAN